MKNDGGPADEMTMRDYFAGQALAGDMAFSGDDTAWDEEQFDHLAERCYLVADALLAAREAMRPQENPDV